VTRSDRKQFPGHRNKMEIGDLATAQTVEPLEFTLFPRLATETRLTIWKMAIPGPRVITIQEHNDATPNFRLLAASYVIPAMLHTSRESREVALKVYELDFTDHLYIKPMYLDFSKDIIFAKDPRDLMSLCIGSQLDPRNHTNLREDLRHSKLLRDLRHLMLGGSDRDFERHGALEALGFCIIREFWDLETLVLEPRESFETPLWTMEEAIRRNIAKIEGEHLDPNKLAGRVSLAVMSVQEIIARAEKLRVRFFPSRNRGK
jgi:hypothetical protein